MRTFKSISSAFALTAALAAGPAFAFDASLATAMEEAPIAESSSSLTAVPSLVPSTSEPMPSPLEMPEITAQPSLGADTTASEAFNMGRNLFRRGEKAEAMTVLQFAAGQGHVGAQWMIGRMYAKGEGVEPNDFKAFEYFREIVSKAGIDDIDDSLESRQNAAYVSQALLQLGSYYREGIPGTHVKPNPQLAVSLYSRAAYNYGDPNAQFNLAMMYIEGNGVPKDAKRALQLLHNAAKKGHAPSRALLGHMMFKGEAIKRQPELGLMWMGLARQSAEQSGQVDAQWIIDLHDKALEEASDDERKGALSFFNKVFNN